jgi:hypothetical protein
MVIHVASSFERREPPDPWSGRQPRYEGLASEGADRFFLLARLPSGERVRVQLGRLSGPELRRLIVVDPKAAGGHAPRGWLARLHNPGNRECACVPECWCRRSRLGYLLRWYVPSRWHRLPRPRR